MYYDGSFLFYSYVIVLHLPPLFVFTSPTMLASIPKSITRLSPSKTYSQSDKLLGLALIFLFIFSWSSFLNVPNFSRSRIPAEPIRNSTLGVRNHHIILAWLLTMSNSSRRYSRWRFLTEKTERSLSLTLQRPPTLPSLSSTRRETRRLRKTHGRKAGMRGITE